MNSGTTTFHVQIQYQHNFSCSTITLRSSFLMHNTCSGWSVQRTHWHRMKEQKKNATIWMKIVFFFCVYISYVNRLQAPAYSRNTMCVCDVKLRVCIIRATCTLCDAMTLSLRCHQTVVVKHAKTSARRSPVGVEPKPKTSNKWNGSQRERRRATNDVSQTSNINDSALIY